MQFLTFLCLTAASAVCIGGRADICPRPWSDRPPLNMRLNECHYGGLDYRKCCATQTLRRGCSIPDRCKIVSPTISVRILSSSPLMVYFKPSSLPSNWENHSIASAAYQDVRIGPHRGRAHPTRRQAHTQSPQRAISSHLEVIQGGSGSSCSLSDPSSKYDHWKLLRPSITPGHYDGSPLGSRTPIASVWRR